ncbi:unnamed protein product [Meganyctiphanes norvegica]|uniref:SWIM-type domain-containing protein n=1 Tax=Meganyctiphanes norvegica TaxID=48144 RepID=A0AAV2SAS4_MEGNR
MDKPLLYVGKTFQSYNAVLEAKQKYEQEMKININVRRSTKIQTDYINGQRKINVNENLKYTEINFVCKNSSYHIPTCIKRKALEESTGKKKRKTSSFSTGCEFNMKLKVTKDGQKLELTKLQSKHNHEMHQAIFENLPQQRKLDPETSEKTKMILSCDANKKKVQHHLHSQGIKVQIQDLNNLMKNEGEKSNDYEKVKNLVDSYDNLDCQYLLNENVCTGVFLQTEKMKKTFEAYPEIIFIDATYKLNQLNMKLYVMMCMDGNGESEVIALAFVSSDDRETLAWFADCFVKRNPNFVKVQCIMSDKDMTERDVMKTYFPGVHLLICSFHVLRNLRREVTAKKRDMNQEEEKFALEILQGMVYAIDEESYNSKRELLVKFSSTKLVAYFMTHWEPIKDEWVRGLQKQYMNLFQATNNRVESFNGKVKTIVKKYSVMTQCITDLMILVNHYEFERDRRALYTVIKHPLQVTEDIHVAQYSKFLTPYACEKVKEQLELMERVEIKELQDNKVIVGCYSYANLTVSATECSCRFSTGMGLPCRHIFKVRNNFNLPLFAEELCHKRWSARYYAMNQRLLSKFTLNDSLPEHQNNINESSEENQDNLSHISDENDDNLELGNNITQLPKRKIKYLDQHAKFKQAQLKTNDLCERMSSLGMNEFEKVYDRLVQFCEHCYDENFSITTSKDTVNHNPILEKISEINKVTPGTIKGKNNIVFPTPMRIRGHPKGLGQTNVLGLNKKKKFNISSVL